MAKKKQNQSEVEVENVEQLDPNTYVPKISEDTVRAAAKQDRLQTEGIYQWVVIKKENAFSKGKDDDQRASLMKRNRQMLKLRIAPLARENDAKSIKKEYALTKYVMTNFDAPGVRADFPDPKDDPDFANEYMAKTKQYGRMMEGDLRTMLGEDVIPFRPRRQDGKWIYKDEVISEDAVAKCNLEVAEIASDVALKIWINEIKLDSGEPVSFYARVSIKDDEVDLGFAMGELRDGNEIVPYNKWLG